MVFLTNRFFLPPFACDRAHSSVPSDVGGMQENRRGAFNIIIIALLNVFILNVRFSIRPNVHPSSTVRPFEYLHTAFLPDPFVHVRFLDVLLLGFFLARSDCSSFPSSCETTVRARSELVVTISIRFEFYTAGGNYKVQINFNRDRCARFLLN